nr:hypothetical protein [Pedobacter sp. ASV19]
MDISEVLAEFGEYYEKRPENKARLVKQLNVAAKTETLFTPIVTDDTIYRGAESQFSRVVQPFQIGWTPTNPLDMKPIEIRMFQQKVDLDEDPSKLEASWLGFLTGPEVDPAEWPFIRWYIEVNLIPQIQEDIEMNEIFNGKYVAPTPGIAGAIGSGMDGIKTLINGFVTTGKTSPIVMGPIPTSSNKDTYDYMELFADRIGTKYWGIPMQLGVSESVARKALRGKRDRYGQDNDFKGATNLIEETNISIVGLPSMNGSNKIFCTPAWNSIYLRKKTQNQKQFKIESIKRILSLYTDWWIGIGFNIPQIVFTNDQDLV